MKKDKMSGGYIIEKELNGNEKIYEPRSALIKDRIIMCIGQIEDEMCADIVAKLLYLDAQVTEKITLFVSSGGGSVMAGLSVIDTIGYIKSPVETVNIGMCASMGAAILSAGDTRKALKHSQTMLHSVSSGTRGTVIDMKIDFEHSMKLNKTLMKMIGENCGKTPEEMEKVCERDFWMDSEEAKSFGIIDDIIQPNANKATPIKDKKKKK